MSATVLECALMLTPVHQGRRTPEAAGCSKNHTLDPNSVEADSKRQVCNRLPDLLLTLDCLFNEGKLLSSKHNKAAYMEIIKLIATSYQGYANKFATEGSCSRTVRQFHSCSSSAGDQ
ncbi:hypothetical protein D4764_0116420, partial [Takifugu flavidus]